MHPQPRNAHLLDQRLRVASRRGDCEGMRNLLAHGAYINSQDKQDFYDGESPLFEASRNNRHDAVDLLLSHTQQEVDVNQKSVSPAWRGQTALHAACREGDLDVVRLLCAHPMIDVEVRDEEGTTPMMEAARRCHMDVVLFLVQDMRCRPDGAVCVAAAFCDRPSALRMLLERGADPNTKHQHGHSALHVACKYGHEEVVRVLLENQDVHINALDETSERRLPLSWALQGEHWQIAHLLLERGADVNLADKDGDTALHHLCESLSRRCESEHDKSHAFQLLQRVCKYPDTQPDPKDKEGLTPLMRAAQGTHADVVATLLDAGASLNLVDDDGHNALMYAAMWERHDVLEVLLVQPDLEVNARNHHGFSALHYACHADEESALEMVHVLCERENIRVDLRDQYGNTPRDLALQREHQRVARFLVAIDNSQRNPS